MYTITNICIFRIDIFIYMYLHMCTINTNTIQCIGLSMVSRHTGEKPCRQLSFYVMRVLKLPLSRKHFSTRKLNDILFPTGLQKKKKKGFMSSLANSAIPHQVLCRSLTDAAIANTQTAHCLQLGCVIHSGKTSSISLHLVAAVI